MRIPDFSERKELEYLLEANIAHRCKHAKQNHRTTRTRAVMLANVLVLVWRGHAEYYRIMNIEQMVTGIVCESFQIKQQKRRDQFWNKICPSTTTPTLLS